MCIRDSSLCSLTCPVGINTGAMMLKKREERRGALSRWVGNRVGGQFSAVTALTRAGLAAANFSQRLLGDSVQGAITGRCV